MARLFPAEPSGDHFFGDDETNAARWRGSSAAGRSGLPGTDCSANGGATYHCPRRSSDGSRESDSVSRQDEDFALGVLRALPGMVYAVDLVEKRPIFFSSEVATFLGFRLEELPPRRVLGLFMELVHPDDRALLRSFAGRWPVARDEEIMSVELRFRAKDKSWRWFVTQCKVLARDGEGKVRQVAGTALDVTEHRRTTSDLAAREALLSAVVDNAETMIALKDGEGTYLLANRHAHRMMGSKQGALVGAKAADFLDPIPATRIAAQDLEVVMSKTISEIEVELHLAEGSHTFIVDKVPVLDASGEVKFLVEIGADVTDYLKLRDATRALIDGDFRQAKVPELPGRSLAQLSAAIDELGQTLERSYEENRKIAELTREINSGLVLDEILDHLYDSFRQIIPYDRIGVALIDHERGKVVAQWARSEYPRVKIVQGFSAHLAGSSLEAVMITGRPRVLNDLEAYLETKPESHSTRLIVEEGIRSSLTCPLAAYGKSLGFIFFSSCEKGTYRELHVDLFMRIADQLASILEKGELYQRLLELDSLKSRFLGMVAHDLKNPISVVGLYADLLGRGDLGLLSEEQQDALVEIRKALGDMQHLVEELLDIRSSETGHLELRLGWEAAADPLLTAVESHRPVAGAKKIEVVVEVDESIGEVRIDRRRLEPAIGNLLSNAIKFSVPGSQVEARMRGFEDTFEIEVIDQGMGIPATELDHIFDEFYRGTNRPTADERSSGIGLYIVRRIVEAHGGQISVESIVGQGSSFVIRLPREPPATASRGEVMNTAEM